MTDMTPETPNTPLNREDREKERYNSSPTEGATDKPLKPSEVQPEGEAEQRAPKRPDEIREAPRTDEAPPEAEEMPMNTGQENMPDRFTCGRFNAATPGRKCHENVP